MVVASMWCMVFVSACGCVYMCSVCHRFGVELVTLLCLLRLPLCRMLIRVHHLTCHLCMELQ
ncbi:hypothetical protein EON63_14815 [archaeon]|nr:MAG: hypothetical protein EON63_14815 [archaeon]